MSGHELTIRSLHEKTRGFAITFHHPEYGAIRVGHIGERSGNPTDMDLWSWQIGWGILNGREHRHGTAPTKKACECAWKTAWISFKAARTQSEWYEAKSSEDYAKRKWDIFDARKLAGDDETERLTAELRKGGPGPTPGWVLDILARGQQ